MKNFTKKFNEIIIDKLGVDESELLPTARFTEDLGADSLDMVELVMEFEKEFKIAIPDNDTDKIKTVVDAENYILNMLNIKETNS